MTCMCYNCMRLSCLWSLYAGGGIDIDTWSEVCCKDNCSFTAASVVEGSYDGGDGCVGLLWGTVTVFLRALAASRLSRSLRLSLLSFRLIIPNKMSPRDTITTITTIATGKTIMWCTTRKKNNKCLKRWETSHLLFIVIGIRCRSDCTTWLPCVIAQQ